MLANNISLERAAYMARGQKYLTSPLASYVKSCFLSSELPIVFFGIGDGRETMRFASMHADMEGRTVTAYPLDAMDELVGRYADKLRGETNKFIFVHTIGEVEPFLFGLSEEYDGLEWGEESRIKVVTTEPQKVRIREMKPVKIQNPIDTPAGQQSSQDTLSYHWKVLFCSLKLATETVPGDGVLTTVK